MLGGLFDQNLDFTQFPEIIINELKTWFLRIVLNFVFFSCSLSYEFCIFILTLNILPFTKLTIMIEFNALLKFKTIKRRLNKGLQRTKRFAKKWKNFRSHFANFFAKKCENDAKFCKKKSAKISRKYFREKNSLKTKSVMLQQLIVQKNLWTSLFWELNIFEIL